MKQTDKLFSFWSALCICLLLSLPLRAQVPATLNATLDDYKYPYEVKYLPVSVEGEQYKMDYMDVPPARKVANPPAVLLLHGKNFFGAYWGQTIKFLSEKRLPGYCAGPDWLWEVREAGDILFLSPVGGEYKTAFTAPGCTAGGGGGALDGRHAGYAFCAAVPGNDNEAGAGEPDWAGRL